MFQMPKTFYLYTSLISDNAVFIQFGYSHGSATARLSELVLQFDYNCGSVRCYSARSLIPILRYALRTAQDTYSGRVIYSVSQCYLGVF